MSVCNHETKKLLGGEKKYTVFCMSSPRIEVIPRSRKILGCSGFVFALGGLVLFWVPLAGVLLWALGLGISLVSLFVRGARGFGFSGVAVSLICFAFTYVFLVMRWTPVGDTEIRAGTHADVAGGSDGSAVAGSKKKTLADIFSSFGYRNKEAGEGAPDASGVDVSGATPDAADGAVSETENESDDFSEEPDAESDEVVAEEAPKSVVAETHARLPIAHFASISKERTTWPRRVRLMRPRKISLWDAERKVIMGKMEIPAKSVVDVLDVKADGSLLVLDCTGQVFNVLAADTDFAQAYEEKNAER